MNVGQNVYCLLVCEFRKLSKYRYASKTHVTQAQFRHTQSHIRTCRSIIVIQIRSQARTCTSIRMHAQTSLQACIHIICLSAFDYFDRVPRVARGEEVDRFQVSGTNFRLSHRMAAGSRVRRDVHTIIWLSSIIVSRRFRNS